MKRDKQIVIVRWHDAGSGDTNRQAASHIRDSIGYLVKWRKKGIWLSMERDRLSGVHFIPEGMVIDVTKFQVL